MYTAHTYTHRHVDTYISLTCTHTFKVHIMNLTQSGHMLVKHFPFEDYRNQSVLHESPSLVCFSAGTHCELYKDPCANISCLNGGTCDSEGLNGTCICAPGFTGEWSRAVFSNSPHSLCVAGVKQPQTLCHERSPSRDAVVKCQEALLQWDLF